MTIKIYQAMQALVSNARTADPLLAAWAASNNVIDVPPTRIYEDRAAAFAREDAPAVSISLAQGEARTFGQEDNAGPGTVLINAAFEVAIYTRGDPHSKLACEVLEIVHAAIMSDWTLGGHAQALFFRGYRPQREAGDQTPGWFVVRYEAEILCNESTLI